MGGELTTILEGEEKANQIFDLLDVAKATRQDYKARIGLFFDFIRENGFDRDSFLKFKRYLAERTDLAVSSKNKYLITAKIFLGELNRQGFIPVNITQNVKVFSQSRKHKKDGLTEKEVAIITEKLQQLEDNQKSSRLKTILAFLLLQGLRQCEIVRLNVEDIDLANSLAFIRGKGADDKEAINLHPETAQTLKTYLKTNKIADGALFVSQSNNNRSKRLTTRGLRKIVKGFFEESGIEKSTHGTRHFFVSQLVKNYKGDLLEVARYSRHKSLEMLQVYNDNIKLKADLPRFYKVFEDIKLNENQASTSDK